MRIGVAGLGFMGSTHIRALRSIPQAQLVAVCSHDEKKLAGDLSAVQGNLGGPGERSDFSGVAKYRDLRQMLEDPNVDAVDLCLPTHLHAPPPSRRSKPESMSWWKSPWRWIMNPRGK
jgi:predicted dehydrogenase